MSLRQELIAVDEQISAVNQQIQTLRWRRSNEGNRRQMGEEVDGGIAPEPGVALDQNGALPEEDRRLSSAMRVAMLRDELASALHRYMTLQSLLRVDERGLSR